MTIQELQESIRRLKRERDVCVLAHSYQAREIIEVADFSGDSFALSVAATKASARTVVLCGVRFMAETAKLLSPEKTVILANREAGCPMAEQMEPELIAAVKRQYPDYTVVAYVNTTAKLKCLCDVCVTSSSAVDIVRKVENPNILFIPDCNLGDYVAKQAPEKNIKLLQGGCPIHACVHLDDVRNARRRRPAALLLAHPECVPEVVAQADFVGSTAAIMDYARQSPAREFLIGTELSIAEHLQYLCPDKRFYPLSRKLLCPNMKLTTLMDLYLALTGEGGEEMVMDEELIRQASRCIKEMMRLGAS
jgi:quinolinate synthase